MSNRCQTGSVRLVGQKWVGRYWRDVPGSTKRQHPAVTLGSKKEMTKAEARRKLMGIIHDAGVNTPEHLEASMRPVVTFSNIADAWERKRLPQLKPSAQYSAPLLIRKHLRPFFGSMKPEDIKTGTINDWIGALNSTGLKPKSIVNLWKLLRSIVNWHAKQNDQPKRAWSPDLTPVTQDEQRWFTPSEARRIIDAAKGQYKVLFHLAAYSGLRSGELAGLHVPDIDFTRGVIHVRRSVWNGREVSTKTLKGFRKVWIDSGTVAMLRQHLAGRTAGRVFQTRTGAPINGGNVCKHVLTPICEQLGIQPGGMHAFRHGRVSYLQMSGVPADFTKSQVGHSSLRTTSGYTHFTEQYSRETVERLATQLPFSTQNDSLYSVETASKSA